MGLIQLDFAPPSVSVCLLTCNRAAVLPRSLDSLLAQTYSDFELLINDDCSTDETERVGRAYEKKDPRVKYHRNETNLKYSGNSNAAVRRARGRYIAIVHDGDVYAPEMLQCWVQALDAVPSAAFVFNGYEVMADDGTVVRTIVDEFPAQIPGAALLDQMLLRFDSPIWGIVMVRASCLNEVGPFDNAFPRLTDVDMWMRLLARYDAAYVARPLVRIMGREAGHENSDCNWAILRQTEEIRRTNIYRRFHSKPEKLAFYMKRFRRDRLRLYLRSLAWCVYHRRVDRIRQGRDVFASSESVAFRLIGWLLWPFFK